MKSRSSFYFRLFTSLAIPRTDANIPISKIVSIASNIQDIIDRVCDETDRYFAVKTSPVKQVDFIQVKDIFQITLKRTPLLSVKRLQQNNEDIQLDEMQFNSIGTVRLDYRLYHNYILYNRHNNMMYVEYYFGCVEEADDKEFTTAQVEKGTSVNITVVDSSQYTVGNFIRIKGFDGNQEIAEVTALPDATTITVDEISLSHESNSVIEKLIKPTIIDQYILYESGVNAAIQAVGGTYTFATSYQFPKYSVNKGVPYPHFEKVYNSLVDKRDQVSAKIDGALVMVG